MLGVVELGLVGLGTYVVFETKTACDRDQVDDSQLVKDLLQVHCGGGGCTCIPAKPSLITCHPSTRLLS